MIIQKHFKTKLNEAIDYMIQWLILSLYYSLIEPN